MKRFAIGLVLTASVVVGFLYAGSTRTSAYSRLIATSDAALANEDPFVAIAAFSGAIALRADVMLAHLKRGETYHSRGDLEAAVAALGSPASTLLVRLADAHWRAGATGRARAVLSDGLWQHPDSSALIALKRRFD
jgi:hypothetical protein